MNTLSRGDKVLMAETGHFAALWKRLAEKSKLEVDFLAERLAPGRAAGGDRGSPGCGSRASRQSSYGGGRPKDPHDTKMAAKANAGMPAIMAGARLVPVLLVPAS